MVMRKSSHPTASQTLSERSNFQLEAKLSHRYRANSTAKVCIKTWPGLLKLTAHCQHYVTVHRVNRERFDTNNQSICAIVHTMCGEGAPGNFVESVWCAKNGCKQKLDDFNRL